MIELKIALGINEWLDLIKEDKNLNGAYISLAQYIYKLEQALEDETLNKEIAQGHRKQVQDIESYERKELQKYKNIVEELEKWIFQYREEHKNDTGIFDKFLTTGDVLNKLQELKKV